MSLRTSVLVENVINDKKCYMDKKQGLWVNHS